ncbi:putative protein 31 [Bacillus phage Bam35c]|uniref:Uncharacterized protein n=1 Tax=Bacillus phage Bam35c TaxID=236750 RepID=Q6X3T8_BP35C|nr:putative protein 31 [Bacillus phage Bam35c]AAP83500.1 putative protein 31 [Bacillus phage Bam35c]
MVYHSVTMRFVVLYLKMMLEWKRVTSGNVETRMRQYGLLI